MLYIYSYRKDSFEALATNEDTYLPDDSYPNDPEQPTDGYRDDPNSPEYANVKQENNYENTSNGIYKKPKDPAYENARPGQQSKIVDEYATVVKENGTEGDYDTPSNMPAGGKGGNQDSGYDTPKNVSQGPFSDTGSLLA